MRELIRKWEKRYKIRFQPVDRCDPCLGLPFNTTVPRVSDSIHCKKRFSFSSPQPGCHQPINGESLVSDNPGWGRENQ
jgi:hypothetical protein